jgi:hypothetical protein
LTVVDRFYPRGEQPIHLDQVIDQVPAGRGVGIAGELEEELFAHSAEKAFDLPAALGSARGGMDQSDTQLRARSSQASTNADPLSTRWSERLGWPVRAAVRRPALRHPNDQPATTPTRPRPAPRRRACSHRRHRHRQRRHHRYLQRRPTQSRPQRRHSTVATTHQHSVPQPVTHQRNSPPQGLYVADLNFRYFFAAYYK